MANIPTYLPSEESTERPHVYLSPNATPEMFGARLAKQITIIGGAIDDIYKQQKAKREEYNISIARDKLTQAEREIDNYLFSENGAYTRKGEQVDTLIEDSQTEFDKIKRDHLSTISDQKAKDMFSVSFDDFATRNLRALSRHRLNEIEKYNMATLDAQISQDHDNVVKNRYNPEIFEEKTKEIILNTMSKFAGMGPEIQAQAAEDALNLLHKDVIEGYLSDREITMAKDYIEKYGDELDPTLKRNYKEIIKEEEDNIYVADKAMELSKSGKLIDEQLAIADKEKNPEKRKKLRNELLNRFNTNQAIQSYKQEQVNINEWDNLFNLYDMIQDDQGNIRGEVLGIFRNYTPPAGKVSPGVNEGLRNWRNRQLEILFDETQGKQKQEVYTTPYFQWMGLPQETQRAYTFDQIMKEGKKVHPTAFKEIFDEWKKLKNKPEEEVKNTMTPDQFFKNAISGRKDFDPDDKEDNERIRRFHVQADSLYRQLPEDRRNNMEEWNKIVNHLLGELYPHGDLPFFPDKKIYTFEAPYQEKKPVPGAAILNDKTVPLSVLDWFNKGKIIQHEYNEELGMHVYRVDLGDGTFQLYDEDNNPLGRYNY